MTFNLFRLALKNIRSRRTRSWLTILGVLVGVTAVVALLSIGTGVQEAVLQQFEDIGYDIILIAPTNVAGAARGAIGGFMPGSSMPAGGQFGGRIAARTATQATSSEDTTGGTFSPENLGTSATTDTSGAAAEPFNPEEMRAAFARAAAPSLDTSLLLTQVPQLIEAGTLGTQIQPIETETTSGFLRVSTPSLDFLEAFPSVLGGFQIARGSFFTNTTENQVIVGARSAELLQMAIGDSISIDSIPFTVVGILESGDRDASEEEDVEDGALSGQGLAQNLGTGNSADLVLSGLTNTDDSLFVLSERASEVLVGRAMSAVTITRVQPGASISDTKDAINVAIGIQGSSGTPISIQEVADEIQGTLSLIETVLASIAAVALIVGGVGLMNTMYTAVLERTREIGILKSVGARDGQVMTLFLVDSGLMGFIGGILGLILGSTLSLLGSRLLGPSLGVGSFTPIIDGWLVSGVLVFSFVLGALSGVWPAWRASRLNPVDALAAE
ncbi:ABC transporter permease [Candidatus Bipolaricaulota bacterium]|nr:ABC transporter permease [Candidatus Bipolaricaulota bacterium]